MPARAIWIPALLVLATAARLPAQETRPSAIRPVDGAGRPLNLDFETGTLRDWTAEGQAFAEQPVRGDTVNPRRSDMKSEHEGDYWIGTYEIAGDGPRGALTSVAFRITAPFASFLVAGGSSPDTRVELIDAASRTPFFTISGDDSENLRPVVVDLTARAGTEMAIRLVDDETGHWGHINFDAFRFHDARPRFPRERAPGDEMPPPDTTPHAGLPPEEAAAAMTVPSGFRVTLGAAEPDVHQPIAFAIDDRGRLWVAEAFSYPVRRPEGQGKDRIQILEDTDRDGRLDRLTTFAENLNLVSGLEIGYGGVFVGAAPQLLFIPDRNGDDRPDGPPEVLLDGFGFHDTHETLNAFIWGPDGWLWGCHGVFTHSRVGRPGTPDADRVPMNAAIWRFHPRTRAFEIVGEGTSNPWGVDFDDHGEAFATACVIPHLYHIQPGGRYARQAGSHFNRHTYEDIPTVADHLHYAGSRGPHAGNNRSSTAGGGHAHCGAMIYLGDSFPKTYRNALFMSNIHGNRLNVDVPRRAASSFTASHGPDFLLANDRWFRAINMKYGPDGSVWLIDWYDKTPCHHTTPDAFDRTNGRIYRIAAEGTTPAAADLGRLSDEALVAMQLERNDWFVRHARRLLAERGGNPAVHEGLRRILDGNPDVTRRLRAIWALHATGGLGPDFAARLMGDRDAPVRSWAVRLGADTTPVPPPVIEAMAALADREADASVRAALAGAAMRVPAGARWEILRGLLSRPEDAGDGVLPLLVWYAFEPLVASDPTRALPLAGTAGLSRIPSFAVRRAAALRTPAAIAALAAALDAAGDDAHRLEILRHIHASLGGEAPLPGPDGFADRCRRLRDSGSAEVRAWAAAVSVRLGKPDPADVDILREGARHREDPVALRTFCLESLTAAGAPAAAPVLAELLSDPDLLPAALRGLAALDDPKAASAILGAYPALGAGEKRQALGLLASRRSFAAALLAAVREGRLPARDLTADVVRRLVALGDAEVTAGVTAVWGTTRLAPDDAKAEIARLAALVKKGGRRPDPSAGRTTFMRLCGQCHTLFGTGGGVGPDLTGSNRADPDYILENIVDPNLLIPNEYRSTDVFCRSGQVFSGLVTAEDDHALTLRNATETLVIPRNDIEERRLTPLSVMPEGLLRGAEDGEIRDLIAYLASSSQVPWLVTADTADRFFDGRTLAGFDGDPALWRVESGEIVGTSPGLPRNAFLVSHAAAADFRLTVEVRLSPDAGNSGIQFRSRALPDGGVRGFQADIGRGWWGRLYEEEGRGLLSERTVEKAVRPGDWNVYEITVSGSRIRTAVNGVLAVDLDDRQGARRGVFAFQIHSGGPFEVRFRKLSLEVGTDLPLRTLRE